MASTTSNTASRGAHWRHWLTVGMAAAMLTACAAPKPEALVASAKEYLAKNDRKAAIIQLKNALQKQPGNAEARFLLGRAELDNKEVANAEKDLRRARELNYPPAEVDPPLADALSRLGRYQEVVDQFAKASTSTPLGRAQLETALGISYAALGKQDAARAAVANALAAQPAYAPALLTSARLDAAAGDLPSAAKLVDQAIAAARNDVDAWLLKGDIAQARHEDDAALAAYRKVTELQPGNTVAHASVINLLLRENKVALADEALAVAKKNSKDPRIAFMEALVRFRQDNLPAARAAIQEFLRFARQNLAGELLAGAIELRLRSHGTAETYLADVVKRVPNHDNARRLLIVNYLQNGQSSKALEALTPALSRIDKDPLMLGVAGEVFLLNGNPTEASKYYQRAAALEPTTDRRTALAINDLAAGDKDRALTELDRLVSAEAAPRAALALVLAHVQRKEYDKALAIVESVKRNERDRPLAFNLGGYVLLAKGDVEAARSSYERALELDPSLWAAELQLVRMDLQARNGAAAQKKLRSFVGANPKHAAALVALAEIEHANGAAAKDVIALLDRAAAAEPTNDAPRMALVSYYLRTKDTAKAVAAAQEAVAAFPGRPKVLEMLAVAEKAAGSSQQALAAYGKVMEAQPGAPEPYVASAELQIKERDYDGAMQSLRKALAMRPDFLRAQRTLIRLHLQTKHTSEALAVARDVQKQRPGQSVGYVLEGDVHALKEDWPSAIAAYQRGLKLAGTTDLAVKVHAAMVAGGHRGDADSMASGWVKDHPTDTPFRMYLAQEAAARKDYAGAVRIYEGLLSREPENVALLNNFAWAAGKSGDPRALQSAEKANTIAPNQPAIMDTLGWLLVQSGDSARGIELLQKAAGMAPRSSSIRLNLAKGLMKSGQKDAAKKELQELAKLGSGYAGQDEVTALLNSL